jgi:hypothetical protein
VKTLVVLIQLSVASIAVGDVRSFADDQNANAQTNEQSSNVQSREEECSVVTKPVRYAVLYGEHLAIVVHRFGFRPLYGKRSQVKKISELNNLKDPNVIIAGQEILLPFKCEEDAIKHVLIDREESRIIASVSEALSPAQTASEAVRSTSVSMPTPPASSTAARDVAEAATNVLPETTNLPQPSVQHPAEPKPVAAPNPTPSDLASEATTFVPHSTLSIGGLYGFYRLDSKEIVGTASALLLSRPSLGVAFGWDLHWQPEFTTGFRMNSRSIEFQRATSGVLNNGQQTTSGVGLDFKYRWTQKFKSSLGFNYDERLFVRSVQSGTAVLEVFHQPSFELIVEHEMIRAGALGLDFMAGYRQLLQTSIESASLNDSSEYLLGAIFRQQLEKRQIELKINYVNGQQKSSLSNQNNTGLETYLGIKMDIGK